MLSRRRSVPPGLYNAKRIDERPIPSFNRNATNSLVTRTEDNMSVEDDSTNTDVNGQNEGDNSFDNQSEQSIDESLMQIEEEPIGQEIDPFFNCDTSTNSNENMETNGSNTFDSGSAEQMCQSEMIIDAELIPMPNQTTINEATEIEQLVTTSLNDVTANSASNISIVAKLEPLPLYEACSSNGMELEELLDDDEIIDEYDEDVTFYIRRKTGFVKPLKTDSNDLVKHENDIVTGNMSYNITVSSFIYSYMANAVSKKLCIPIQRISVIQHSIK